MSTGFGDPAVVHHQNSVCFLDGGKTMRNDQSGTALHNRFQRFLDVTLRFRIQRRCGFIKDQNRGVLEQRPGDGEPLSLPTGKHDSIVTDHGVQAIGHTINKFQRMSLGGSLADFLARAVPERAISYVGRDTIVKKHYILVHECNLGPKPFQGKLL